MSKHSAAGVVSPDEFADEVVQSHPVASWISINDAAAPSDDSVIAHLFDSENRPDHNVRHPDSLRHLNLHLISRQDSINWILKVHAHYHFNPVTAILAVNYFDRFLSSFSLPENGWPYQLLSVACLSLAAKMEEQFVPLLLDLQIMEPTYLFYPRTVQRMELLVMANLNWKLCIVTPFDFLDYFIDRIPFCEPSIHIASSFSHLVLNTTKVVDFLRFSPSVIAAAAVTLATGSNVVELPDTFYERVNKELLRSCHQLMEECMVGTCPASADQKLRSSRAETPRLVAAPPSPVGVLDSAACASCNTRYDNPSSASESGGGQQHEPEHKRLRTSAEDFQVLERQ